MASPGAYASPLRENQVGLFGEGVAQPPTPNTNVRVLIAQKEKVRVPRRSRGHVIMRTNALTHSRVLEQPPGRSSVLFHARPSRALS